jgi:hypothetical protein
MKREHGRGYLIKFAGRNPHADTPLERVERKGNDAAGLAQSRPVGFRCDRHQ